MGAEMCDAYEHEVQVGNPDLSMKALFASLAGVINVHRQPEPEFFLKGSTTTENIHPTAAECKVQWSRMGWLREPAC